LLQIWNNEIKTKTNLRSYQNSVQVNGLCSMTKLGKI